MADAEADFLSAVDLQTIEIQGYLKKQGPSSMSGWKKRYCILHSNGRLRYFEDESMDKECNDIMLSEITEVKREKSKVIVSTINREWRFEAEDDSEALLWKKHFTRLKRKTKNNDHFGIACQGWLHKQGGGVKTWKKRYCILNNDGTFKYYTDDTLKEQKKQDVCLSEIIHIGHEGDEFWVRTANREWRFRSDDEDDRAIWLESFRNFLVVDGGVTPDFDDVILPTVSHRDLDSSPSYDDQMSHNVAKMREMVDKTALINQSSAKLVESGDSFEEMCKKRSQIMKQQKKKSMFGLF